MPKCTGTCATQRVPAALKPVGDGCDDNEEEWSGEEADQCGGGRREGSSREGEFGSGFLENGPAESSEDGAGE